MLPFFVLGYPLKHLIFGFNLYSFVFVSQGLASLYVCFFPQIKECMPFGYGKIENIEPEDILPRVVKSFEIKPKNIMSVVPLLVHKRKNCWEGCFDADRIYVYNYLNITQTFVYSYQNSTNEVQRNF